MSKNRKKKKQCYYQLVKKGLLNSRTQSAISKSNCANKQSTNSIQMKNANIPIGKRMRGNLKDFSKKEITVNLQSSNCEYKLNQAANEIRHLSCQLTFCSPFRRIKELPNPFSRSPSYQTLNLLRYRTPLIYILGH